MWKLNFTKHAQKDAHKLKAAGLKENAEALLEILKKNPFQNPSHYEKLNGELTRVNSRRINIQHRLIYEVLKDEKVVKVIRMWSHYE